MHAQNVAVRGRFRRKEISRISQSFRKQPLAHQPVLLRRKHMRPQMQVVPVVVDKFERQHSFLSLPRTFPERKYCPITPALFCAWEVKNPRGETDRIVGSALSRCLDS